MAIQRVVAADRGGNVTLGMVPEVRTRADFGDT
jgi:hypothetical protein